MARIRYFVLLIALTFSFGGFSFYAGIVVPIGSEVFDTTSQGFVTQKVTNVINLASAATGLILLWDVLAGRRLRSGRANSIRMVLLAIYALCLIGLAALHPRMDALLDEANFLVLDSDHFYNMHRVYLWGSTFQWLATIGLIGCICSDINRPNDLANALPE